MLGLLLGAGTVINWLGDNKYAKEDTTLEEEINKINETINKINENRKAIDASLEKVNAILRANGEEEIKIKKP